MGDFSDCEKCGAVFVPSQYTRHHKMQADEINRLRAENAELKTTLDMLIESSAKSLVHDTRRIAELEALLSMWAHEWSHDLEDLMERTAAALSGRGNNQ